MEQGRFTRLRCTWSGSSVALVALYVPAKPDERRAFLSQLAVLPRDPSSLVVVGGDFNCALEEGEMQQPIPYLRIGRSDLQRWVTGWGLADAWTGPVRKQATDPGWTKRTYGGVGSRIDRLYVTADALQRCTAARTVGVSSSDHHAVLLTMGARRRKRTRWRLNTELLQHPELRQRVAQTWRRQLEVLARGEKTLQEVWTDFKNEVASVCAEFGSARARARRAARAAAEEALRTAATAVERAEAKATLQQLDEYEVQGKLARLGVAATYADRPTAEFFARMSEPATKLEVHQLTLPTQEVTSDAAEMTQAVNALWQGVYGAGHPPEQLSTEVVAARERSLNRLTRRLSGSEARGLAAVYSEEELLAALKSLPRNASPGNDGLPPAFYVTFWKLLGKPLTRMLNEAAAGGALPAESLQARIILLPKTAAAAPRPSDFRPISLLNTEYKVRAKTVSRRLAGVMDSICSPRQTGFVPKRSILHNIAFNRDLLEYKRADSSGAVIAFLDFEKAFDRVNWTYRDAVLRRLGVPEAMLRVITAFYAGATSQLELNGVAGPWFHPTRGVRQGCPLSPLLFALFAEPLGALLDDLGNGRDGGGATGIELPVTSRQGSSKRIGGSQYADDTVVYCCGVAALERVLGAVETEFCTASGAALNRDKTRVLPVGEHEGELPDRIAGAEVLKDGDRVKSLGAICSTRLDEPGRLPDVLSKMERRLTHLMALDPSLLGRALVANTLLSSCLWYFLQFEELKQADAKRASDLIWQCLWHRQSEGEDERRVKGKVSRAQAAAPRSNGGLGIIEPAVMAKALHARSVNLLLAGRGQWWAAWSEAIIQRAARTGPGTGTDALAVVEARPAIISNCPPYWAAALKAWSELQLVHPPAAAGSTMVTLLARFRQGATPVVREGLHFLAARSVQYLSDVWDRLDNRRLLTQRILNRVNAARVQAGVAERKVERAYALIYDSLHNSPLLGQMAAAVAAEPAVGSFHRLRGQAASAAVTLVMGTGSSGCTRCTLQRAVRVKRIDLDSGRGALPSAEQVAASARQVQQVCSCTLSPLLNDDEKIESYGEAETTALIPQLLENEKELKISSKVEELRAFYRVRTYPASAQRPPCEAVWTPLLAAPPPSEEEWEQLWLALQRAQVEGKVRTLAWLLLHRRRPLLSWKWLRDLMHSSAACRMCSTGEAETSDHLFHRCPTAQATWARLERWMSAVGLAAAVSTLDGRLVGRVQPHWPTVEARWPEEEPPVRAQVEEWLLTAWAEVRSIVLFALWSARCRVIYAGARREREVAEKRAMIRYMLTYLYYRHLPSRCPWELPRRHAPPRGDRLAFLSMFWDACDLQLAP
jgi:hypothetical protein